MPTRLAAFSIAQFVRRWTVRLGARRIEFLIQEGALAKDIAFIGGGSLTQADIIINILAADKKTVKKTTSPITIANLRARMDPYRSWWQEGKPAREIALAMHTNIYNFNALVSQYRKCVDVEGFPVRLGTSQQIRPRLRKESMSDKDLKGERVEVRKLLRKKIPLLEIREITGQGVHRIHNWGRKRTSSPSDVRWMTKNEAYLTLGRKLWDAGANHMEIACHYRLTPGRMHLIMTQARRASCNKWFPSRTTVEPLPPVAGRRTRAE